MYVKCAIYGGFSKIKIKKGLKSKLKKKREKSFDRKTRNGSVIPWE